MKTVKVSDLSGLALDWTLAVTEGVSPDMFQTWWHGMVDNIADSLIDSAGISVIRCDDEYGTDAQGYTTNERIPVWAATIGQHTADDRYGSQGDHYGAAYSVDVTDVMYGPTRRIAAMRAYIAWKKGRNQWDMNRHATVEVPEELL